mmetsp:Transcript_5923/g.16838  ORF Transcript_5923/g.16838 Transcript_5923/m.16838 type:complete len:225 (+) Transcript_5923:1715-2389(+)
MVAVAGWRGGAGGQLADQAPQVSRIGGSVGPRGGQGRTGSAAPQVDRHRVPSHIGKGPLQAPNAPGVGRVVDPVHDHSGRVLDAMPMPMLMLMPMLMSMLLLLLRNNPSRSQNAALSPLSLAGTIVGDLPQQTKGRTVVRRNEGLGKPQHLVRNQRPTTQVGRSARQRSSGPHKEGRNDGAVPDIVASTPAIAGGIPLVVRVCGVRSSQSLIHGSDLGSRRNLS